MAEWNLTPEWIFDNWTGEEFVLLTEKLAERKQREADAMRRSSGGKATKVSDKELFSQASGMIKVVGAKRAN